MMFYKCAICGRNGASIFYNNKFFCSECINLFGTCALCVRNKKCDFRENLAPIPQFITKHIRQQTPNGYIEQIVQTPNSQRIKAFCMEGNCICCKTCDDEKVRCMRQFGTCENYKEIEF